jgi:hypothetical protein
MMLLTLPMAAPALIPSGSELRWADAPVLSHKVRPGETLSRIAASGLQEAGDVEALAEANGMMPDTRLRPGQIIEVPGAILKREMLSARVTGFSGVATLQGGEPLAVGMTLSEGDIIETGPGSFVTLAAAGKRVTLPSSSRVKIAALHRVVLNGELVRSFSLLPVRNDWLAQVGLRGEGSSTMLALGDSADGLSADTARE